MRAVSVQTCGAAGCDDVTAIAADGAWLNPTTVSLRALDRIVRGQRPLPAARLALPSPGEAPPPSPPAADGRLPAAAWAFGIAGVAAIAGCALLLVPRRRGPTAA